MAQATTQALDLAELLEWALQLISQQNFDVESGYLVEVQDLQQQARKKLKPLRRQLDARYH